MTQYTADSLNHMSDQELNDLCHRLWIKGDSYSPDGRMSMFNKATNILNARVKLKKVLINDQS